MKTFFTSKMVAHDGGYSPSPRKPSIVVEAWRAAGVPLEIEEPPPVTVEDFALAHERRHVEDILELRKENGFGNCDPQVASSLPYTTGAMLAAARWAIAHGSAAAAPCSGFHHAGWVHAAAYCTFNGLMVTACRLRVDGTAERVAILDCDQHFGNGTEDIIEKLKLGDWCKHVTACMHYPTDVTLLDRLPGFIEEFAGCDVVLYQAGADAHIGDPLGGYLTTEQMARRDDIVFSECRRHGLPVAWNLAGGYQQDFAKVVEIHTNTALACERIFANA